MRANEQEISSLRSKQSQFALHSPLATHLVSRSQPRIEARNRRTRYIIERWLPRAGAVVRAWRERASWLRWMAAGNPIFGVTASSPAPGRVSSYRTPLSAALSLPSRATEAPPVRMSGSAVGPPGLSNVLRARGPAPESQRYAEIVRCAADAANAAPWRTGGSLCRCSLRPVRRPAQLAVWPPRRSAASATPPPTATSAAPLPAPRPAPRTRSGQRALAALDTKPCPQARRASVGAFRSAVARRLARPCAAPRQAHGTCRAPRAPDSPAFHFVPLRYAPVGPVPSRSPTAPPKNHRRGGTAPKRGARCLPTTPLRSTA